jgi:hypothetical protein
MSVNATTNGTAMPSAIASETFSDYHVEDCTPN